MPLKKLHIISFDNPYPPVYGGVIDVFYKIKALHAEGYEIYLHCFVDEDQTDNSVLKKYVSELYIYKRKFKSLKIFSIIPLPVRSRFHQDLVANISKNEAPLLFEGLQTTFLLKRHKFPKNKLFLRLHNLESDYFMGLSRSETSLIKKLLYRIESFKYRKYQKIMSEFETVFTLSRYETRFVSEHFGNAMYVPVFHGNTNSNELSEFGKYAIYHGDLRMADNKKAALFLINVFKKIPDYKLIIASNKEKKRIEHEINEFSNISFCEIEDENHLNTLLSNAHMSVMLSFQQSGTKLKAINSLYKSRFCIINKNMVDDENIRSLCTIAETETDFTQAINTLKNQPYNDSERRISVLNDVLNDAVNAQKIDQIISAS